MTRACVVTSSARHEVGELLMLYQATMDEPDAMGRLLPDRYTVTVKILRSPEGQIVASTRITTPDDPAATQPELKAAAQRLADRIIGQVRHYLTGQPDEMAEDTWGVAANAEAH